jgi:hypothetical protein
VEKMGNLRQSKKLFGKTSSEEKKRFSVVKRWLCMHFDERYGVIPLPLARMTYVNLYVGIWRRP